MSDIQYWKPVAQLFKPEQPLVDQELLDFYVQRENSPVEKIVRRLALEDEPAKYLLSGHRGGGKTTELKRLEKSCKNDYAVVWVDTDTNLDKFNIGYAEVVVLIGMTIVQHLESTGWEVPAQLSESLLNSLMPITYQNKNFEEGAMGLPKLFSDLGLLLRVGFQRETKATREVRPALSEIIDRVNDIIAAASAAGINLLVIVDGLDRKEYVVALEMFSSALLTALHCSIVYVVPIALRYSPAFRQPMQGFSNCFDLDNVPVFECSDQKLPTTESDSQGRKILRNVVNRRLDILDESYQNLIEEDALELLCEKSGGVIRDLVRLAKNACLAALDQNATGITKAIAEIAVKEERRTYSINDYQFPELDVVNRTGMTTSNVFDSPKHGKVVICEELLHHKLILGYQDPGQGRWFDINPILADDLTRWRAAQEKINGDRSD